MKFHSTMRTVGLLLLLPLIGGTLGSHVRTGSARESARESAHHTTTDPYAHHKVKSYYQNWHDPANPFALVETAASAGVTIFHDTSHCADPFKGGAQEKAMHRRYDLRADTTKTTSPPALEGTLRSRCVPKVDSEGNTALTDQCLFESSSCNAGDVQCHIEVRDCPPRGESTVERPRWAHSGHNYKENELVKYHFGKEKGNYKCLKAVEEDKTKEGKAGHFKAVPYLAACPPRGETPGDDFLWYLEPRVGTFVSKASGLCLTLKSPKKKGREDAVTLRPCNRQGMPISQGWDLYDSTHSTYATPEMTKCKNKLPSSVTELGLDDWIKWIVAALQGKVEKVASEVGTATDIDATLGNILGTPAAMPLEKLEKDHGAGSNGRFRLRRLRRLLMQEVNGKELRDGASGDGIDVEGGDLATEEEAESPKDNSKGFFKTWTSPMVKIVVDALQDSAHGSGSWTQGVVYGLPLNNGFYKFKSKDGYNCHKLPLAAHANQRVSLTIYYLYCFRCCFRCCFVFSQIKQ